jgi:excisionase family DNA binding protein
MTSIGFFEDRATSNKIPRQPTFSVLKRMTLIEQIERKQSALTVDELASLLQCSPKLIYKLIKQGKLNAYRIGTSIRIDGQDAGNFLAQHATIPQKPLPAKRHSRFPA